MQLSIHHDTTYRYRGEVELGPHRLMLVPRSSHDLRILTSSVRCTPHAELDWAQDVFGNLVATAIFAERTDTLVISADVTVELGASAWPIFRIAPTAHSYPFGYNKEAVADLGAFLEPQQSDDGATLDSWARGFILGPLTDTLSLLKDINIGIGHAVAYRPRDEEGTQMPLETLSLARGSCRDMTALFIDAVRRLGFGARAVSGYLYDPEASVGDPGSTHAWAEVYLPSAGWIAFDPVHQRVGSFNLIPVAVGRYNGQIMPITGDYVGEPSSFVGMDVRVLISAIP
jgi:transglutaminase-like putative cysteine protease